jgi:quercetin dioxygenase-like cupin family protein
VLDCEKGLPVNKGVSMSVRAAGEIINVRPLGADLAGARSTALMKTDSLEVIRMVIHEGKKIPEHTAPGDITVHCIEGHIVFTVGEHARDMKSGDLLFLEANEPHSLEAVVDSSILLTITRCGAENRN